MAVIFLIGSYLFLRGSLPLLSGHVTLSGLQALVTIERDSLGIPTITGKSRLDVARATGFIHAQERFFQMDLMRRAAAGELSELFGSATIEFDKTRRLHRFRKVSQTILNQLSNEELALVKAYAEGVNQGLANLFTKPFEYAILLSQPLVWLPEDTILVSLGLFFELQDADGRKDLAQGYMKALLPEAVYQFFINNGSVWTATLDNSHAPILPIPGPEEFAYLNNQHLSSMQDSKSSSREVSPLGGSNHWAITGAYTHDGQPILACDMHLSLSIPNIWYRAAFVYSNQDGELNRIYGATLPGTPFMIIGSNTYIAWGFTNAYIDTTDLTLIQLDPNYNHLYMTPKGPKAFDVYTEIIKVKGENSIAYPIVSTIWGPILKEKFFEKYLALNWIAHQPDALNMRLTDLENVKNVQMALESIKQIKIPILNFLVADRDGHIGWSLIGAIPKREGFDGTVPVQMDDGTTKWLGCYNSNDYPSLFDPPQNLLWTANNRCLGSHWPMYNQNSFLNSIRAYRIREQLNLLDKASEKDMLAIQLDTKACFFERWRSLLLDTLNNHSFSLKRAELKSIVESWNGYCSKDSAGYYWIRQFRDRVTQSILQRCFLPCLLESKEFSYNNFDFEEPVWLIVSQKPSYLKNPHYDSWEEELISYIDKMLNELGPKTIQEETWGKHSILQMQHPLSRGIPLIHYLLDMPQEPLSGDYYVPYVSSSYEGASQRMIVSPNNEKQGIFHSPGGQSGHPLSSNYQDGHHAWIKGLPTPFLPGDTLNTLILDPL